MDPFLELNSALDLAALSAEFARAGLLQIRNVFTDDCAAAVRALLVDRIPWCLAWQAGASAPAQLVGAKELAAAPEEQLQAISVRAAADPDYGYAYYSYPLVTAYLEQWNPGSPQERLLEELNSPKILDFMRAVTGMPRIVKMDGQATLYGPGHFLRPHNDAESERGRLIAYVLNLTVGEWRPDWGGYLNFFDEDWNVSRGFRPRFNSLNLFRVPRWHNVGQVAASAPFARYAITGWARDR